MQTLRLYLVTATNAAEGVKTFTESMQTLIKNVALPIATLCIVAAGLLFMFGGETAKGAKKWIMYIVGGIGIVLLGVSVITGLWTSLGGTI